MFIVNHRKVFYFISIILVVVSLVSVFVWGLKPSIDFKGGAILEVEYENTVPQVSNLKSSLDTLNLGEYSIRPTGEKGIIVRMRDISPVEKDAVLSRLSLNGKENLTERRFDSIGPILGREAVSKSVWAIIFVIVCIVIFITFAFRKVSLPVSSWKYGLVAIIALIHDVLVPMGVFAILGHFFGYEIDTLFITALLVILGFSVHDTIVVFDRVRENLKTNPGNTFAETVGKSISQTFVRSINTSLTVVLALFVLYFLGSEATRHFSLALLVGIVAGTYSSIFLGSPLLVTLEKWQNR